MVTHLLQRIFLMGCLAYIKESYVIRCPEQAEWNIRAEIQCQNITKYFCLYNYINYTYEEGCTGPDWDRPGSKRLYSRNFNRVPCRDTRYQPIKFKTNGSSDCIFKKSLCTEEGQTLFSNGTTRTDSTCRCDYTQGYAFVTVPRSKCYCQPSEEDCSCYLKKCQGIGYYLSADYECSKDITKKNVCSLMSENPYGDPHFDMVPSGTPTEYDSYAIRRKFDVAVVVLGFLFGMIVTVIAMYINLQERLPRSRCPSTEETVEVYCKSERMDADTIEQNATNDISDEDRLEENASENNEDQIALSESDANWKSAVEEVGDNIKKNGQDKAFEHFNAVLDNWKSELVKLAVIGKSGVGKSSFINAIRNLKPGDRGFATTSCSGYTTKRATVYKYPGNPKITLYDLPGFGTTQFPKNEYQKKKTMQFYRYDYILIFVENIEKNDIVIAKTLKEMKKPFCFVRSKLDLDIENAKIDGELEAETIGKIKSKSLDILTSTGLKDAMFFVISNRSRKIGYFNELVSYIQRNLPALKCDVVMFSLLGELSDDIIDSKYQMLKNRLWKVLLSAASMATAPIPNSDVMPNKTLICKELLLYHKTFGFGQQIVKDISKIHYISKRLTSSSIVMIEADNEAMQEFVQIELEKLSRLRTEKSEAGTVTYSLLNRILDGCRHDAKQLYRFLILEKKRVQRL